MQGIDILQVVTSTDRRGAETFAVELGRALRALGATVETVALAPGLSPVRLDLPVLGTAPLRPRTLRALRQAAHRHRLVVAHGSTTLPACAIALATSRVPFVYRNIGDPAAWSGSGLRRLRTRLFLRRAAAVVALTAGAATTLEQGYGVPADRLAVIPTGASATANEPADAGRRARAREALGIAPHDPVVAMIGALSEEKCPVLAVEAMAGLEGAHLVVAGDGPLRAEVEAAGASLAPGRVHMLGSLPDPSPAFDAADVVVLPSRTEGLPGVLVEAGLRALPAVATDVGYVRDIVRDGATGVIVPRADVDALRAALARVLADPGELGARARDVCLAEFGLDTIAPRWNETLARVLRAR